MANKKILEKKQTVIDEIKDKVNDSSSFVLFDYRGLTDAEIKELRCALRNADANYKVYKNTLMARAFNDLNIDLSSSLEGPSAFAYSKDQVAPIKVLSDFAKDHEALVIKAGIVEGKVLEVEEINEIAKLPGREGMYSMLLGMLQAPVSKFARVVKAVADAREENGGEAPVEAPAEEKVEEAAE